MRLEDIYKRYQPFKLSVLALLVFWVVYFVVYLPLDGKVNDLILQIKHETSLFERSQTRMIYLRKEIERLKKLRQKIDTGRLPRLRLYLYKGDVLSFVGKVATDCGIKVKTILPLKYKKGVAVEISGNSNYSSLLRFLYKLKSSEYIAVIKRLKIRREQYMVVFSVQFVVLGEVR